MDVDNIPPGIDFVDVLAKQVSACDIFLAVIGPNWLNAKDEIGNRRLENPNDYVAVEIAAALRRNIPVVPLLVDGTRIPLAHQLPDSIRPLARRHAVEVRTAQFRRDVQALTDEIRRAIESKQAWLVRWVLAAIDLLRRRWGVVTAGALVGLFSGISAETSEQSRRQAHRIYGSGNSGNSLSHSHHTASFAAFTGRALMIFRAGLALNTVGSLVNGLMPARSLVAGFLMTTNFAKPGSRKAPVFLSSL
jgi:hypothetical protein